MLKALATLLLLTAAAHAQSLPIDRTASSLSWTGHAEVGTYAPTGSLAVKGGEVVFRNGNFTAADLSIDMTSLSQSNTDLAHHLKSADFFDVDHFPTATVHIDKLENGIVFGTLTLKNKTAPFQSPVQIKADGQRFTITGHVQLDRTTYGIVYNSSSFFSGLGNKAIRNTFEVEFNLTVIGVLPMKYRQ